VRVRSSYVAEDVVFGARFANIYELTDAGGTSIDVQRISEIERVA
jgi:hypothetical protein